MWLFFVFRVRLREYFRLFIVLAADHEKITKQNKTKEFRAKKIKNKTETPTCKKNKKQKSKVGEVL